MENNSKVHIPVIIAGMLMIGNNIAAQQLNTDFKKDFKNEKTDSELKLNEDAIKLIKFDFMPEMNNDATKPLEAPLKKPWMEFKADLAVPKSLTDTTKVRKPKGYIHSNDDKLVILVCAIYLPISFSEKRSVVHSNGTILKNCECFSS